MAIEHFFVAYYVFAFAAFMVVLFWTQVRVTRHLKNRDAEKPATKNS
jgi:hypothetical protein